MPEAEIVADLPPPAPPPAPTSEIHVGPETIDHGPMPDAPRPGTARHRMMEDLRRRAKQPEEVTERDALPTRPPTRPKPEEAPPEPPPEQRPGAEPRAQVPKAAEETGPAEPPASATPEEKKRVNPWKLIDQYKEQTAKLQKEISDLRSAALPKEQREDITRRMDEMSKRNKELEDHIRFVDYSKSAEFKHNFDEPYEKAWVRAMKELGELRVAGEDGTERALEPRDILQLVNLPLPQAREMADQLYGSFADDIMAHRKEIRLLFEARNQALEDARKNGEERVRQNTEVFQRQMGEMGKSIKETWDQTNEAILRDEKYGLYFAPVEGDENVNQRLAKGYELVDRAFSENPNDPRLSADDRRAIIKRHAAVRNRAAAFGRLIYDLEQARTKIKALTDELGKYRGSEPPTGGSVRPSPDSPARPTTAYESVFSALRAKAR